MSSQNAFQFIFLYGIKYNSIEKRLQVDIPETRPLPKMWYGGLLQM